MAMPSNGFTTAAVIPCSGARRPAIDSACRFDVKAPLTYIAAATSFRPALLRSRVRVLSLAPQNSDDPTHDVRVIGFAERTNARRP
jgi:hypothetical protein